MPRQFSDRRLARVKRLLTLVPRAKRSPDFKRQGPRYRTARALRPPLPEPFGALLARFATSIVSFQESRLRCEQARADAAMPAQTFWTKTKTGGKTGFDKVYGWVDKLGAPINRFSNKLGSEAFWPTTIDKESEKAARILRSFCSEWSTM